MWYSANLLFEALGDRPAGTELWEETIILIEAGDAKEAAAKAEVIGKSREIDYLNSIGKKVDWRFRKVERVYELGTNDLVEGTELFARFLRASEVRSLLTPFQD